MKPPVIDMLLSQRFLPEQGGSIRWMYEVYRRWPAPVQVVTHNYYDFPLGTSAFPDRPARPPGGDDVADPGLRMDRRDIFLDNWGLDRPDRVRRYWRMNRAVAQRLRGGATVRVHCTHAVPEAASLVPLKWRYGSRLRIISYGHGEEITACRASRQLRWIMKQAHQAVDLMLVNSRYTAGVIAPFIDAAKVRVVNPGVEMREFDDAPELGRRWRDQHGLTDRLIVLTVGRLDPRKNHAAVIEAVARLANRFPALTYVVAGQGRELPALRELAARRGVEQRVIFAGAVDAPTKLALYGGCDVFAMPAIRDGTDVEGFGMVFLEAAACGKPSVAGREGGQAEAVIDGVTGFTVDGTDAPAVTRALESLLSDAALRARMGDAGREHARQFDWPAVVQRIVELVEDQG